MGSEGGADDLGGRAAPGGRATSGARAVRVTAPAKINLALRILGRRADGYHELDTLFQAISLADEVLLEPREEPGVGLTVVGADVGPAEDNLAVRAARAWASAAGIDPRVHVRLEKRIPAGAGLGGGSSDAGAVLRGLEAMHGHPLGAEGIRRVGAALGADVAFFCGESALARGEGIGERLTPLAPLPTRELVVVVPSVPVPTAAAYGWLAETRGADGVADGLGGAPASWADADAVAGNDFHDVVSERVPEVAGLVRALREAGLEGVLLSGSGSAVFGFLPAAGGDGAPGMDERTGPDGILARVRDRAGAARVFPSTTLRSLPEPELL